MLFRRRSLLDLAKNRLSKGPRRKKAQRSTNDTRLGVEPLEDRRMLAVDVFLDGVTGFITIMDDSGLGGGSGVEEDNNVTLSLGNFDPDGGEAAGVQDGLLITDPDGVNALTFGLLQVSATEVFVPQNFDFLGGVGASIQNVLTSTVVIDLQSGDDDLVFEDDADLVPVVTNYVISGGDNGTFSDVLTLEGTTGVSETITISPDSIDADETIIFGYGGIVIDARGYESIIFEGEGADDSLTVDLGAGTVSARAQSADITTTDEIISDSLPDILIDGFDTLALLASFEPTQATFVLDDLEGANNYLFSSRTNDTLVVEGSGGSDPFTATLDGIGDLQITGAFTTLNTTGMDSADLLQVNALGGDDSLTVDVNGTALIDTPIFYDGGSGSDVLTVEGTPMNPIDRVEYFPGLQPDEGRLEYDESFGVLGVDMIIDFDNLEPVVDLVPAAFLTVNGTGEANSITYVQGSLPTRGLVSIDGFETIDFENKTSLSIFAEGGDDTVVIDNPNLPTGLESISVSGNEGNDTIRFDRLPDATATAFVSASATGGTGADVIDGGNIIVPTPLSLFGSEGNDTITGGAGLDDLQGFSGNDTFIDSPGDDLIDGGTGNDTFVVQGTILSDFISVAQLAPSGAAADDYVIEVAIVPTAGNKQIAKTNPGSAPNSVGNFPTLELIVVEGLTGDDAIFAGHADEYENINFVNGNSAQTIPFEIRGDSPNASDRLVVPDFGLGDLIIQRQGADQRSGTVSVGTNAPISYSEMEGVDIQGLNPITAGTGTDGNGRLVVFKDDPYESNNTLPSATFLGAGVAVNVDPTIDPSGIPIFNIPGDNDFYQFVAQETGTLDLQLYFEPIGTLANGRPGLPVDGELMATVLDSDGVPVSIATANDLLDPNGIKIGERVTVPVVRNNTYYLRVEGEPGDQVTGINVYNFTAITISAPIPQAVDLQTASDTGESFIDNITFDATPTFDIILDDDRIDEFANADLIPDTVDDDLQTVGFDYGVEVFNNAVSIGFAFYIPVGNTWRFTAAVGDLIEGDNNLISAAVWIRDPANPNQIGRGELSEPLQVTLDTIAPAAVLPNLLDSSDSGMFNNDNVTNKWEPAFNSDEDVEVNNKVYVYASIVDPDTLVVGDPVLIGSGLVGSDLSNDIAGDGLGIWEVTVEPLVENVYDIIVRFEDWAGNFTPLDQAQQNALRIVIDKTEPNTPLLDLVTDPLVGDSGRNDIDEVTKVNTPQVTMTSTDPNVHLAQVLFADNYKFRIYDRYESFDGLNTPEFLLYDSALDIAVDAVSFAGDMFTSLELVAEVLPEQYFNLVGINNAVLAGGVLADGVHNLKLEVEDRAGNISHDFLLEIVVDTVVPPVSFGLPDAASEIDGLTASSDSGVTTVPDTYADRVTNDTTPTMWGRAEANSIVQLYLDRNANGTIEIGVDDFLGSTVAVPFDGNDAYPEGYWEITSALDLNQLVGMPKDGLRRLLVTAEDLAGNPMVMGGQITEGIDELQIFIDTQGPQVTDVRIADALDYDLFDPKPSEDGPTPLVNTLRIDFQDLPNRLDQALAINDFLYEALVEGIAETPGNYQLVGDHVGTIAIQSVVLTLEPAVDGMPATAFVELTFVDPLPDDRFTLTILDNLVDPANNNLDGESNANEPLEMPLFPSGDGVPGGDFVARFTIDTRPEIGSYVAQNINLDINGNFVWDPANGQIGNDATNVDLSVTLPVANPDGSVGLGGYNVHDLVFSGKFSPLEQLIVGDDAVFVIDVSGSTSAGFGGDPVGDLNSDGTANTVLDAQIAAFIALNQELIDRGLGNTSNVSIVSFDTSSDIIDMDPVAAGVQVSTTPLADTDGNGVRDVNQALMALMDTGSTNFEAGLADAISVLGTVGTAAGNGNVIFLSDGSPNAPSGDFGVYADEVTMIRDALGMNLRAFGVGPGASLPALQAIDPTAISFSNTNELLAAFAGGGVGGVGDPSGFDQLAAYGNSAELGGVQRWIIDTNNDAVVNPGEGDILTIQPLLVSMDVVGAIPVAGNFDGNLANGDEIGLYNAGTWAFDFNRDFVIQEAEVIGNNGLLGHPIVGDFDGDGIEDAAVFNNNFWTFDFGFNGFLGAEDTLVWGFPGVLDRPVAADMDYDGVDDIGLWVPRNSAQPNRPMAEWYFLISNDFGAVNRVTGTINTLDHAFEIVPFGNDLYAEFGDELALPIVGNFDPPVADAPANPTGGVETQVTTTDTADFNNDGQITGLDFMAWIRGFGTSANSGDEPARSEGDANFDSAVDDQDLAIWLDGYGHSTAQAAVATSADFNNDLIIDGSDLAAWQNGYGTAAVGNHANGDANNDGVVSGADFFAWQRIASTSPAVASATAPASIEQPVSDSPSPGNSVALATVTQSLSAGIFGANPTVAEQSFVEELLGPAPQLLEFSTAYLSKVAPVLDKEEVFEELGMNLSQRTQQVSSLAGARTTPASQIEFSVDWIEEDEAEYRSDSREQLFGEDDLLEDAFI